MRAWFAFFLIVGTPVDSAVIGDDIHKQTFNSNLKSYGTNMMTWRKSHRTYMKKDLESRFPHPHSRRSPTMGEISQRRKQQHQASQVEGRWLDTDNLTKEQKVSPIDPSAVRDQPHATLSPHFPRLPRKNELNRKLVHEKTLQAHYGGTTIGGSPQSSSNVPVQEAFDASCRDVSKGGSFETRVNFNYTISFRDDNDKNVDSFIYVIEEALHATVRDSGVCSGWAVRRDSPPQIDEYIIQKRSDVVSGVVKISSLPRDVPIKSCGRDCLKVRGGMTITVLDGTNEFDAQCVVMYFVREGLDHLKRTHFISTDAKCVGQKQTSSRLSETPTLSPNLQKDQTFQPSSDAISSEQPVISQAETTQPLSDSSFQPTIKLPETVSPSFLMDGSPTAYIPTSTPTPSTIVPSPTQEAPSIHPTKTPGDQSIPPTPQASATEFPKIEWSAAPTQLDMPTVPTRVSLAPVKSSTSPPSAEPENNPTVRPVLTSDVPTPIRLGTKYPRSTLPGILPSEHPIPTTDSPTTSNLETADTSQQPSTSILQGAIPTPFTQLPSAQSETSAHPTKSEYSQKEDTFNPSSYVISSKQPVRSAGDDQHPPGSTIIPTTWLPESESPSMLTNGDTLPHSPTETGTHSTVAPNTTPGAQSMLPTAKEISQTMLSASPSQQKRPTYPTPVSSSPIMQSTTPHSAAPNQFPSSTSRVPTATRIGTKSPQTKVTSIVPSVQPIQISAAPSQSSSTVASQGPATTIPGSEVFTMSPSPSATVPTVGQEVGLPNGKDSQPTLQPSSNELSTFDPSSAQSETERSESVAPTVQTSSTTGTNLPPSTSPTFKLVETSSKPSFAPTGASVHLPTSMEQLTPFPTRATQPNQDTASVPSGMELSLSAPPSFVRDGPTERQTTRPTFQDSIMPTTQVIPTFPTHSLPPSIVESSLTPTVIDYSLSPTKHPTWSKTNPMLPIPQTPTPSTSISVSPSSGNDFKATTSPSIALSDSSSEPTSDPSPIQDTTFAPTMIMTTTSTPSAANEVSSAPPQSSGSDQWPTVQATHSPSQTWHPTIITASRSPAETATTNPTFQDANAPHATHTSNPSPELLPTVNDVGSAAPTPTSTTSPSAADSESSSAPTQSTGFDQLFTALPTQSPSQTLNPTKITVSKSPAETATTNPAFQVSNAPHSMHTSAPTPELFPTISIAGSTTPTSTLTPSPSSAASEGVVVPTNESQGKRTTSPSFQSALTPTGTVPMVIGSSHPSIVGSSHSPTGTDGSLPTLSELPTFLPTKDVRPTSSPSTLGSTFPSFRTTGKATTSPSAEIFGSSSEPTSMPTHTQDFAFTPTQTTRTTLAPSPARETSSAPSETSGSIHIPTTQTHSPSQSANPTTPTFSNEKSPSGPTQSLAGTPLSVSPTDTPSTSPSGSSPSTASGSQSWVSGTPSMFPSTGSAGFSSIFPSAADLEDTTNMPTVILTPSKVTPSFPTEETSTSPLPQTALSGTPSPQPAGSFPGSLNPSTVIGSGNLLSVAPTTAHGSSSPSEYTAYDEPTNRVSSEAPSSETGNNSQMPSSEAQSHTTPSFSSTTGPTKCTGGRCPGVEQDGDEVADSEPPSDLICDDDFENSVNVPINFKYNVSIEAASPAAIERFLNDVEDRIMNELKEAQLCSDRRRIIEDPSALTKSTENEHGSRFLVKNLVKVTSLPTDKVSGECGTDCIVVDGGVTATILKGTDMKAVQCEVLSIISDLFNELKEASFMSSEVDCTGADFIPAGAERSRGNGTHSNSNFPIGAVIFISIGSALLIFAVMFFVARKRKKREVALDYMSHYSSIDPSLGSFESLSSDWTPTPEKAVEQLHSPESLKSIFSDDAVIAKVVQKEEESQSEATSQINIHNASASVAAPAENEFCGFIMPSSLFAAPTQNVHRCSSALCPQCYGQQQIEILPTQGRPLGQLHTIHEESSMLGGYHSGADSGDSPIVGEALLDLENHLTDDDTPVVRNNARSP